MSQTASGNRGAARHPRRHRGAGLRRAVHALIARRIRELGVYSVILPCWTPLEEIRALQPAGLVLSGGPSSVYDAEAPKCDPKVLEAGKPVLGICYGLQWMAYQLGGRWSARGRAASTGQPS
jgi:GMP synthase-like glutamine amidotransferase